MTYSLAYVAVLIMSVFLSVIMVCIYNVSGTCVHGVGRRESVTRRLTGAGQVSALIDRCRVVAVRHTCPPSIHDPSLRGPQSQRKC